MKKSNGKLKIVYMIDMLRTDLAGTENQLIKIIKGLDRDRFDITLVCFKNHEWFEANAGKLPCASRVIDINRFKRPQAYINFVRLVLFLRSHKPDVVQTFFPTANIIGVVAAKLAGVRNIVSSRRDFGEWMIGRYLTGTRAANRFVDVILANSNKVAELTVEKERVAEAKVKVIYNGIDSEKFANLPAASLKELGVPEGNKVVGIVANFRPMKHHHTFILSAAEVLKARKDVTFILIGTGQLKEKAEELARSLNIEGNMIFAGASKDVSKYLSVMDIGVNCSEGEGLSNAIIEYMAAGVPCVVSKAGGNPDLITHDLNGYIFEIDDHKTLARDILTLLDDSDVRRRFIDNSMKRVKDELSLEAMLSKHEQFYEGLCRR